MKTLPMSLLILVASTAAAYAGPFTFQSDLHVKNQIVAPQGKTMVAGTFFQGTANITYADGQTVADPFNCAAWTTEAGAAYPQRTVCDYTEGSKDTAALVVGCKPADKTNTAADCEGDLVGTGGRFAGKSGTVSWHQQLAADGKSGTATGKGAWND